MAPCGVRRAIAKLSTDFADGRAEPVLIAELPNVFVDQLLLVSQPLSLANHPYLLLGEPAGGPKAGGR